MDKLIFPINQFKEKCRMLRSGITLSFTLALLSIMACSGGEQPTNIAVSATNTSNAAPTAPIPAATIDELASGRRLYMSNCANCHKEDGTGGEVTIEGERLNPDDLTGDKVKSFPDDKILRYIMNGVPDEGMPAFKGKLSEAEMRDVVKFVRAELQKMPAGSAPKS
jgi:mono/diheme cytochrome c family protein